MSANRHSTRLGQLELVGAKFKGPYECMVMTDGRNHDTFHARSGCAD